jgi:hypothetical protein
MKGLLVSSLFLISIISFGQPGPSGGMLAIKVFRKGKQIELPNANWQIIPTNITLADKTIDYSSFYFVEDSSMYYIVPQATPAGGNVADDFYLDIVFGKDTMTIFPPSFKHRDIILDSIPFQKGVYKIPQSVYDFRELSKKGYYYGKTPVPNLIGDWDLFTRETYKCYIEKVEDLDEVPNENAYYENKQSDFKQHWQSLSMQKTGVAYYFNDDVIVAYSYALETTTIYEVKDFSDIHYFRSQWRPSVRSLFSKGGEVYAIIYKNSDNSGIFKLHFVNEKPTEDLNYLLKKQITEEYEAELKGLRLYDQTYRDRESPQITRKYEAVLESLGLR